MACTKPERLLHELEFVRSQTAHCRHLHVVPPGENWHVVGGRPPSSADESDLYRSVRFHHIDPFDDIDRELIHVNNRLLQNRPLARVIVSQFTPTAPSQIHTDHHFNMELWLVRHGETIVGQDGLYKPHHGLTELGFRAGTIRCPRIKGRRVRRVLLQQPAPRHPDRPNLRRPHLSSLHSHRRP